MGGIPNFVHAKVNLSVDDLLADAAANGEGTWSETKAFTVQTGKRTGRSPKDRYIVRDTLTDTTVDWGKVNQPISPDVFHTLWAKAEAYLKEKTVYVSHYQVGADSEYGLPVTVITELAWHQVFVHHLFIRDRTVTVGLPEWTVLNACSLQTTPADGVNSDATLILNFAERKILLIGLLYAGEMKKAMFSVLNFLLPNQGILPMHCAANVGECGDVALFFGLSGTGKTTLSADPNRYLIGDDEHGWSERGVFNFEGGCYAKCINLSKAREPMIWDAIRDGAIMENVVLRADNTPDYDDGSLTQNTRAAYPLDYIEKRIIANRAGEPEA